MATNNWEIKFDKKFSKRIPYFITIGEDVKQFISDLIEKERKTAPELCRKTIEINDEIPMGVSQWKNHGIKNGYDKYFKIVWTKK